MKKLTTILFFFLFAFIAKAQDVTGAWYGKLNVQGTTLHVVFHITKQTDSYSATMDSPDQGAQGLALDNVTYSNYQLKIGAPAYSFSYTGTFIPDSNKIKGTFMQGPTTLPLVLSRDSTYKSTKAIIKKARPQYPSGFPYSREEVMLENKKAGTTMPMKDLNRLMQKAVTGSVARYSGIEKTAGPAALGPVAIFDQ